MDANNENQEHASVCSFNPMMLSTDHVYLAVLNAAIELNLFEIIGKGSPKGMSASEIASKLGTPHAGMAHRLDRMLFLLSNYSFLTCSSNKLDQHGKIERLYGLSPGGKYLITNEDETSYVRLFKLCNHPTFIKIWQNFKQVILDEEEDLFKTVNEMSIYEYMEMDPTFKTTFHGAMADLSIIQMKDVLETYKGFEGISTLVDVVVPWPKP
ncbi:isoliquiritigenin 2'-O-methyltransferase-like [Neltuma alba]|uniref:isoliquiritigenin 2'-O-methyltransferase-like n=1 Tax=Neltuma alba TaxID=207710 RepID=UPI0010A2C17D|nr:isoliquiritigenin 2'-O-methyltransferase-like [Prosopis alba]